MPTFGLIVGNRGFFPAHLCQAGRRDILIALEKEGIKVIALPEEATKFGAVESLAEHPAIMTHASVPAEARAKLGISDTMVRLSVGVEHIDDILGDLKGALQAVVDLKEK